MRDRTNKKFDSPQLPKSTDSISDRHYRPNLIEFFEIAKTGHVQLVSFRAAFLKSIESTLDKINATILQLLKNFEYVWLLRKLLFQI